MISILTFILIFVAVGSVMAVVMAFRGFKKDQEEVELEFGEAEPKQKRILFKPKTIEEEVIIMNPKEMKSDGADEGSNLGVAKAGHRKKGDNKKRSIQTRSKRTRKQV